MSNRKLLLAHIREGHYAHAGEEEAIELTMKLIQKNTQNQILDVGCGLGGTANYIEKQGYGKVTGIDIDPSVLHTAKELYSHVRFELCDANSAHSFFSQLRFNVIYSFNAFFCFKTQKNCLTGFSEIAENNADLLLFDYTSPGYFTQKSPFCDRTKESSASTLFAPINLDRIERDLFEANWQLNTIINLDAKYRIWYQSLILKMEQAKNELIQKFDNTTYHDLYTGYVQLLTLLEQKKIGGAIIHATHRK